MIFDISNTWSWLGFAQKHIWNIIDENIFFKLSFFTLFKVKSSIVFQICFWVIPSRDLVFGIPKIIQNYDQKYISGHVLACTWNRHLNFIWTHCVGVAHLQTSSIIMGNFWSCRFLSAFTLSDIDSKHIPTYFRLKGFWNIPILQQKVVQQSKMMIYYIII